MKLPLEKFSPVITKLTSTIFSYNLPGGFVFEPSYLHAGLIVILIFLLILTLGQLRKRITHWEMRGIIPGFYLGLAVAIIVEGIFIVGGRTILTEVLGWKNAPKPITKVLDAGRSKMVDVLGVTDEIPSSNAQAIPTIGGLMSQYENLTEDDKLTVQQLICE